MRRLLRIRLVLVLFALVLAPAAVLPFAERLRTEWTKFWEPEPIDPAWAAFAANPPAFTNAIFLCPTDWSSAAAVGQGQPPADGAWPIVVIEPVGPAENDGEPRSDVSSNPVERSEEFAR